MSNTLRQSFLDALQFRHACKAFDNTKKISDEDFDFILKALHLAPSSFGLEPWKFLIVQNEAAREKIKAQAWGGQNQIPTSSHFIVLMQQVGRSLRYDGELFEENLFQRRKMPPEIAEKYRGFVKQFQEKDFELLASQRHLDDWAARQVYIPLSHLMIAAAMIGVDSCPMEGFNRKAVSDVITQISDINPQQFQPAVLLALGYRQDPQPEKLRKPLDDIVEWVR